MPHLLTSFHGYHIDFSYLPSFLILALLGFAYIFAVVGLPVASFSRYPITFAQFRGGTSLHCPILAKWLATYEQPHV